MKPTLNDYAVLADWPELSHQTIRPYTDLLLHDMGADLSDPSPANPERVHMGIQTEFFGYGGGSRSFDVFEEVPANLTREWRTPPLWGVADSAPYLHDGRAATLAEAIKLHSGQASSSVNRFAGLSDVQQEELIAFLNTLRAPSVVRERPVMAKGQISNSSAARLAFGDLFKLNVAGVRAGSLLAASNSSGR